MNEWIKVKMFRTVQDPMIGPKPRQAFMIPDNPGWEAYFHIPSGSVHVKVPTPNGSRIHIVTTGNLNGIETFGEDYGPFQDATTERAETEAKEKRSPGRPKLQPILQS